MSLATELKIQSLDNQITFIEETLKEKAEKNKDGEVSCRYEGFIYKETFEYFQNAEIEFKQVGEAEGIPIWQFWPRDIWLSDKQREEASLTQEGNVMMALTEKILKMAIKLVCICILAVIAIWYFRC